MPKIVDHDKRRQDLATAAGQVLVSEGLEGLTTRRVAEHAGVSKGILSHYFDSKADLVVAVLKHFYGRVEERILLNTEGLTGLTFVRAAMIEALPLDTVRTEEAIAEVSFAAVSVSDPDIRRWYRTERQRLQAELSAHIDQAIEHGDIVPGTASIAVANELLALMDSTSLQVVGGGPGVEPEQQITRLDEILERVSPPDRPAR